METVTKFMTRLKTGDYDDNILHGPSIGIPAGQVKEDVHYMESRGSIDLSSLRFHADDYPQGAHSGIFGFDLQTNKTNEEHTEHKNVESFLDIAVFEVPEHCTSRNCDLSKFGVGSLSHFNGASYLNLCQDGRLQLDHNSFKGHHIQVMVPIEGPMPSRIKQHKYNKFSMPESRRYDVMLANCHNHGRHVHVMGQVVFDVVDDDATINNLTGESLTILVLVAFAVFALLTILAVRINWGTQADFDEQRYGLVPDTDDEGEAERNPSGTTGDGNIQNEVV